MRRAAALGVLLAAMLAAPAASAQSLILLAGGSGGKVVSGIDVPIAISGQLAVSFHGDPASGCEARGVCGYSGTIAIDPGSRGDLLAIGSRVHRRIGYEVLLALGEGAASSGGISARVARVVGGKQVGFCADGAQPFVAPQSSVSRGRVTLGLIQAGGDLLTTRCAGPLDGDVAAASPTVRIGLASLLRGHMQVDLAGAHDFAGHGFAGTVSSTLVLHLGTPKPERSGSPRIKFPKGIKTTRTRIVSEQLRVSAASGKLKALFSETTTSVCQLLDSCTASGSLTLAPFGGKAAGSLLATGPARRPMRDFLTALGIARDGNPHGIDVAGSVNWFSGGSVKEGFEQSGLSCNDTAPLGGGFVSLQALGGSVSAGYSPEVPPRTRCPGPLIGAGQQQSLATGSLSRHSFDRHTFTVHLHAGGTLVDDGYTALMHGSMTVTVARTNHIRSQEIVEPG